MAIHADAATDALAGGSVDDLIAGLRRCLIDHVGFPDDRDVGGRSDGPGTKALEEPPTDEHEHMRRQPTDRETDPEERQARDEGSDETAAIDQQTDDDDPDQVPEEERREDPAVQVEAAELLGDDRHDGRYRERLERDEGNRQHETDGERPPSRRPETVAGGRDVRCAHDRESLAGFGSREDPPISQWIDVAGSVGPSVARRICNGARHRRRSAASRTRPASRPSVGRNAERGRARRPRARPTPHRTHHVARNRDAGRRRGTARSRA